LKILVVNGVRISICQMRIEVSMFAGQLALVIASLSMGAAIYVNVAEQPSRLKLDDRALLAEWGPAFCRSVSMRRLFVGMMTISVRGQLARRTSEPPPVGPKESSKSAQGKPDQRQVSRHLIEKWGQLHAVRSALGASATALFLWAALSSLLSMTLSQLNLHRHVIGRLVLAAPCRVNCNTG
jgi:hypothetical protein